MAGPLNYLGDRFATDAEAKAKASQSLALSPSNIPSILASPGEIGGTSSANGTFNNLVAKTKVILNSSEGPQILAGSGSPSGVVTAPKGSLFLRTDASSTSTRAYINTDSASAWTTVTTAT